jgi:hypothetical protein
MLAGSAVAQGDGWQPQTKAVAMLADSGKMSALQIVGGAAEAAQVAERDLTAACS